MNDYKYNIYSPTLSYGSKPNFITNGDLSSKAGFSSVYSVKQEDAKAIEEAGTTAGFRGIVWSERLWIDVDSYEAADEVEAKLKEMELDYVAYDTGGRGAHFGILRPCSPSHVLPAQDKEWVKAHFEGKVDLGIYTHLHLFRLPGTVHASTGRTKELVTRQSGKGLIHGPWQPKHTNTYSRIDPASLGSSSIFINFDIMAKTIPARVGDRHGNLVRIAYALREANVPVEVARWWVYEVNKLFSEPKEESQVEAALRGIL